MSKDQSGPMSDFSVGRIGGVPVKTFRRGDIVAYLGLHLLDALGARVRRGTIGVVFEEFGFDGPDSGPMVRWQNGGACNVYDGDGVIPVDSMRVL